MCFPSLLRSLRSDAKRPSKVVERGEQNRTWHVIFRVFGGGAQMLDYGPGRQQWVIRDGASGLKGHKGSINTDGR